MTYECTQTFFLLYKYILRVNKDSMTVFWDQSDQSSADLQYRFRAIDNMYLRLLFAQFLIGLLVHESRTFDESKELLDVENEAQVIGVDNLMWEQPIGVVVELKEPLLESVKQFWEHQNLTNQKIVLATINSKGLQDTSIYNESSTFLQAIQDLNPSFDDSENLTTLHLLNELLEKSENLYNGSLMLMTMTTPSDKDFAERVLETFAKKQCKLSVFWLGDMQSDYQQLQNLARKTNGQFQFAEEMNEEIENNKSHYNQENLEPLSGRIKFPETGAEMAEEEGPLKPRVADQRVLQRYTIPLIIEVASGTSLEARPGSPTQITFSVKNNINTQMLLFFEARFNGIAQQVQPLRAAIQPGSTYNVVVNLQPFSNAQTNAVGTLTLIARADNRVTARSALIYLTPQTTTDRTEPRMEYRYEGDCSNYREPQNCENGHWGLSATVRDEDSGLLKVLSEPYGLSFQSEFIAGTKSPVTVFYSATCCQPNVHIWAEDLRGNFVKKSFDVFNQTLLAGEIASIVVGVLLLILIIIAIIAAVIIIKRRNRRNMIIPRARPDSR